MQIATIAPKPPVRTLIGPNPAPVAGPGPDNPLGVTSYGTMRVGHALNGVTYSEHKLLGPLRAPFQTYTGSLEDAIAAAQHDIHRIELTADMSGRLGVALLGMGTTWHAQVLYDEPTVMRAIDNGPGAGGIASISFPSVSRSLGALVTSQGSLIPSQPRAQG